MNAEFLQDYLPIILFLIIALGLSCAFIVINFLLFPKQVCAYNDTVLLSDIGRHNNYTRY